MKKILRRILICVLVLLVAGIGAGIRYFTYDPDKAKEEDSGYATDVDGMTYTMVADKEGTTYVVVTDKDGNRYAAEYDGKLTKLQEKQREITELLRNQSAIMFHCAFDYVAEDYGINVAYCMDLDEERQVSAGEVAKVLSVIETEAVSYIFAEELYGKAMCETVQKEADVTVIYLDPLNRGEYEANSYIDAMSRNIQLLKDAFRNEI